MLPLGVTRLGVDDLNRREHARFVVTGAGMIALTMLTVAGMVMTRSLTVPLGGMAVGAIILVCAVAVWLWHAPVRGVYVLMAASSVLPMYYRNSFPDPIGQLLPYFPDISMWTSVRIVLSVNELFMILVLIIWLMRGIAERTLRFDRGSLWPPLALYMLMILAGWLHGLGSGGDFRISLWEVRGQTYMFVTYILACNLIKTRRQVSTLLWTLVGATGLRGIEGTMRYLFTVRSSGDGINELYPHEQAFFFNAFLTLVLILFLYGGSPRMKRVALILTPFVVFAALANHRRAAVAAFAIAILVMLVVTLIAHPASRRMAAWILIALAIAFPPYYVAFQHGSGTLAEPARAIASNFHPDARDSQSNQYRLNENADIIWTMKVSPIIGYGFGKPMLTPYPLPNISRIYDFWNIMPHNSILWVWMRTGTLGYLLLWFLLGGAIMQSIGLVRRLKDHSLRGIALFVALMLIQEVIFAYLDLQWTNWRNLIAVGILFALISRLSKVDGLRSAGPDTRLANGKVSGLEQEALSARRSVASVASR